MAVALTAILAGASLWLLWQFAGGLAGWLYLAAYALICATGLPLGWKLFGRRHGAGWIAGCVFGYGLVAFAWGLDVQAGFTGPLPFAATFALVAVAIWIIARRLPGPLVALAHWTKRDTAALLLALMLVPVITGVPFMRIGSRDTEGRRSYRAYFTADYLWHVALTSELARFDSPPRNPYLVSQPLHYYWTYFNVPAVASAMRNAPEHVESHVKANAYCAGLLFIAAIFAAAWAAVPRAWAVCLGVWAAVVASSAEGLFGIWRLRTRGEPLTGLRDLNIDALTSWFLESLTIDGLQRSLFYTPQHAFACACALIALIVASQRESPRPLIAAIIAGAALGIALVCSPFLGGAFAGIYGVVALWRAARTPRPIASVLTAAAAAVPVALALVWCVFSGTFEGAGGAVAFGLSRRAAAAPFQTLLFALGPILAAAIVGLVLGRRRDYRWHAAIVSLAAGLVMFYLVTLTKEPVWIGWRAGQIILVTIPALAAAGFAALAQLRHGRSVAAVFAMLIFAAGTPTTAIDAYNAADITHTAMGPGFRWTVVVPRETEAAVDWIREITPRTAIVQMSIDPRGRETWTLIPSLAQRRMAAGQPISLLTMPEYDEGSRQVDAIYRTLDAAEAHRIARSLQIDFIFLDDVERAAYSREAIAKFHDTRYFTPVFWKGPAEVIKVQ